MKKYMRRVILCLFLALLISIGIGVKKSYALLILSGDSTIASGFHLSEPTLENDTFFTNILNGRSSVFIDNGVSSFFEGWINDFYNSLPGVTSTIYDGTEITSANLAAVDLFVSVLPENAYTNNEITILGDYLAGGGSIFFLGEYEPQFNPYNTYINNALSGLGSGMSISSGGAYDPGNQISSGTQITSDPMTSGVSAFGYGAFSEVQAGSEGKVLFYGSDMRPYLAYEGSLAVPEPSSLLLLGTGLFGLIGFRRRFK